jgi:hypothetical protein
LPTVNSHRNLRTELAARHDLLAAMNTSHAPVAGGAVSNPTSHMLFILLSSWSDDAD